MGRGTQGADAILYGDGPVDLSRSRSLAATASAPRIRELVRRLDRVDPGDDESVCSWTEGLRRMLITVAPIEAAMASGRDELISDAYLGACEVFQKQIVLRLQESFVRNEEAGEIIQDPNASNADVLGALRYQLLIQPGMAITISSILWKERMTDVERQRNQRLVRGCFEFRGYPVSCPGLARILQVRSRSPRSFASRWRIRSAGATTRATSPSSTSSFRTIALA